MTNFLIKGARGIFTGLPGEKARTTGDIRVRAGVITEIGALTPEPNEKVVDASGCVVTPGLVNTHHHLFQSLMKGYLTGSTRICSAGCASCPTPTGTSSTKRRCASRPWWDG